MYQKPNKPIGNTVLDKRFVRGLANRVIFVYRIILFSEVVFVGMQWAPKYSRITEYTSNGHDALSTLPDDVINTKYVNSMSSTSGSSSSGVALKQYNPYSSINFAFGIKYVFGKKKE